MLRGTPVAVPLGHSAADLVHPHSPGILAAERKPQDKAAARSGVSEWCGQTRRASRDQSWLQPRFPPNPFVQVLAQPYVTAARLLKICQPRSKRAERRRWEEKQINKHTWQLPPQQTLHISQVQGSGQRDCSGCSGPSGETKNRAENEVRYPGCPLNDCPLAWAWGGFGAPAIGKPAGTCPMFYLHF